MIDGLKQPALPPTPDAAAYARDVLALCEGEMEDDVDERLETRARELGVDWSPPLSMTNAEQGSSEQQALSHTDKRHSSKTLSSDLPRRSASISSKASQSTGLTSNFSDYSRDFQPSTHAGSRSRASLSFRDYDGFLSRSKPYGGRQSMSSFSPSTRPLSPSPSLFSLHSSSTDSSPKRHFRRLRGLSMLRLHKNDSNASLNEGCSHCPPDAASQRRAVHRLPCGHRLCTQALRNAVAQASESKNGVAPSCCGHAIPAAMVESVVKPTEQMMLSGGHGAREQRKPSLTTPQNMGYSRPGALSAASRTTSDESRMSRADSIVPRSQKELEVFLETDEFRALRQRQEEQRDRFVTWLAEWRSEHEISHLQNVNDMNNRHETAIDDLQEQHAATMSDAEDKQVKAEADMRKAHEQERRDNATALKHMEAYCAGTYSTGDPHNRTVTEQDRAELEKTRRARELMDPKHDNAINVLRGEQSRRILLRSQRQDKEVQALRLQHRRAEMESQRQYASEVQLFTDGAEARKSRLIRRWELQTRIWLKQREAESGVLFTGRLPLGVEWKTDLCDVATATPQADEQHRSSDASNGTTVPGKPVSTGRIINGTWKSSNDVDDELLDLAAATRKLTHTSDDTVR